MKIDIRAQASSCFSVIWGMNVRFNMSWATEVEMTRSKPAAVDSAAASAPATTSATTQAGSSAISGLASTMMSLFTFSSFVSGSPTYWMMPSLFLSSNVMSPVPSHLLNHSGIDEYSALLTVLIRFVRAKAATAGAVV